MVSLKRNPVASILSLAKHRARKALGKVKYRALADQGHLPQWMRQLVVASILSLAKHRARKVLGKVKYRALADQDHLPQWMRQMVGEELAVFTNTGITPHLLDAAEECYKQNYRDYFVRYTVKSGRLTHRGAVAQYSGYIAERFHIMTAVFSSVASGLPDFEWVVYLGDGFTGWSRDCPAPVFGFSKHKRLDRTALLLPDPMTLVEGRALRNQVAAGNAAHPWTSKLDMAFWRGATTGGPHTLENYQSNVRFRLVDLARTQPELIDAAFTEFHSCDQAVQNLVRENGSLAEFVDIASHMRYKYLIVVDGFTSPWPRFFWGLHTNSVLIRQDSDILGWVDSAATPEVHYISVKTDLSDLIDKLNWAKNNDETMKLVSTRAQELAAQDLTQDNILGFVRFYLASYAKLFG